MTNQDVLNADDMHSACLVDENGKEIPITRQMIENSCQQLSAEHQDLKKPPASQ